MLGKPVVNCSLSSVSHLGAEGDKEGGSRYGLMPFDKVSPSSTLRLRAAPDSTRTLTPSPSPKGRGVKKRGFRYARCARYSTRVRQQFAAIPHPAEPLVDPDNIAVTLSHQTGADANCAGKNLDKSRAICYKFIIIINKFGEGNFEKK